MTHKQDHDATMVRLRQLNDAGDCKHVANEAIDYIDELFAAIESERAAHAEAEWEARSLESQLDEARASLEMCEQAHLSALDLAQSNDHRADLAESQLAETARERDAARKVVLAARQCGDLTAALDSGGMPSGVALGAIRRALAEHDAAIAPPPSPPCPECGVAGAHKFRCSLGGSTQVVLTGDIASAQADTADEGAGRNG
jgi:hypothetical protein